jgi:hypothetical protein
MAAEKKSPEVVEVPKDEFEQLLAKYESMQSQIDLIARSGGKTTNEVDLKEEARLLKIVKEGNEKAKEKVEVHVDMGAIRSNKNIDISINGKQVVVPKGKTIEVERNVAEIIDNAKKQREISLGLQEERAGEAAKAKAEGGI